jgi:hypothetical protein
MSDTNKKFVRFDKYCKDCVFKDTSSTREPCDSCLSVPAREHSEKPEKFVKKEN